LPPNQNSDSYFNPTLKKEKRKKKKEKNYLAPPIAPSLYVKHIICAFVVRFGSEN
jgi:hypothetical protein